MPVAGSEAGRRERARGLGWRALEAFANRREASILVVAIGLIVYFSLRSSAFYSSPTIKNIAEYVAPVALITCGEVMLLICGEIDLSVGRVFALTPIVMYWASSPDEHGWSIWVGALLGLLAAVAVGLANGLITTYLRIPSFIT